MPGWNDIEGYEIYLGEIYARNTTLSWFEADAKAVEVGGYLAEITSEKETKIFQRVQECKNMLSLLDEVSFCNKLFAHISIIGYTNVGGLIII